jgi:hypothetical protein
MSHLTDRLRKLINQLDEYGTEGNCKQELNSILLEVDPEGQILYYKENLLTAIKKFVEYTFEEFDNESLKLLLKSNEISIEEIVGIFKENFIINKDKLLK